MYPFIVLPPPLGLHGGPLGVARSVVGRMRWWLRRLRLLAPVASVTQAASGVSAIEREEHRQGAARPRVCLHAGASRPPAWRRRSPDARRVDREHTGVVSMWVPPLPGAATTMLQLVGWLWCWLRQWARAPHHHLHPFNPAPARAYTSACSATHRRSRAMSCRSCGRFSRWVPSCGSVGGGGGERSCMQRHQFHCNRKQPPANLVAVHHWWWRKHWPPCAAAAAATAAATLALSRSRPAAAARSGALRPPAHSPAPAHSIRHGSCAAAHHRAAAPDAGGPPGGGGGSSREGA